jgi:cyclopropane fatty-acyl-phospholipid synthase-like methyltransferase
MSDNTSLFEKIYSALEDSSLLLVQEFFIQDGNKTASRQAILFSLSMLVQGGSRCYTVDEVSRWLMQTGFLHITEKIPGELITAQKTTNSGRK